MIPVLVFFTGRAKPLHVLIVAGSAQFRALRFAAAKVPDEDLTEETNYLIKTRFSVN